MRQLLLGAGNSREKRIVHELSPGREFEGLVTLDLGDADVIHDLDILPYPFEDGEFDEIHAYEVLEHCGSQGDFRYFFGQFNEFHRILKPGGVFCGSVPHFQSVWAWGDPGHRRVLPVTVFNWLDESFYANLDTPMSDYRRWIKGYWRCVAAEEGERVLFLLQKV